MNMIADHNDMFIHLKASTSHASKTTEAETTKTDFDIDTMDIDQLNDLCNQALEAGTNQKEVAFSSTHKPTLTKDPSYKSCCLK